MKVNSEHIKYLIKLKSLRQKEIASTINVSSRDWSNWMHRGSFPHYNKLEELAKLLGVAPNELLIENKNILEPAAPYKNHLNKDYKEAIPFFNLERESAHKILLNDPKNEIPFDQIYIPGLSADFVINYFGKEMYPTVANGDLIALRHISDHSFFNFGHLYLIVTKEQLLLRYLKANTLETHLTLGAENKTYDEIELPKSNILSIYMVILIIKKQTI